MKRFFPQFVPQSPSDNSSQSTGTAFPSVSLTANSSLFADSQPSMISTFCSHIFTCMASFRAALRCLRQTAGTAKRYHRPAPSAPQQRNCVLIDRNPNRDLPVGISTVRAILTQAALLPLPRRHHFLAAAANLPELAYAFEATAPAGGCPPLPVIAAHNLQSMLQALAEDVRAAPAPEPHKADTKGAAASAVFQKASDGPEPGEVDCVPNGASATVAAVLPAAPEAADMLSVSVMSEYDQYGLAADDVKAVVSLKAVAEAPTRAHVALTCVLDRSGSMSGKPIKLVRDTCHFLIDQLTEDDYLGLISYAGNVREDLPLLRMTPAARTLAHAIVRGLEAGGSTALYDGLAAGVRQQMAADKELRAGGNGHGGGRHGGEGTQSSATSSLSGMVQCCFLFTDGQATDGPSIPSDIIAGLKELQAPSGQHVTVHTFGFGSDHSVDLLQQIAEAQSGVYYYISCTDDIACGFGDALGGLLAVVAKDVRVEVRIPPGVTLADFRSGGRVLGATAAAITPFTQLGDRNRPYSRGGDGSGGRAAPTGAAFNDMFAEETRECLLVLKMPAAGVAVTAAAAVFTAQQHPSGQRESLDSELAEVDLHYTDVATGRRVERTAALRVRRSVEPRSVGQLPAELVFVTAARFKTLDAIEGAQRAAEAAGGDDVSEAHKVLDDQLMQLQASPLQLPQVTALVEQTRLVKNSITPRIMLSQDRIAAMASTVQVLRHQRVGTSTENSPNYYKQYDTRCKKFLRQRASVAVHGGSSSAGSSSSRADE